MGRPRKEDKEVILNTEPIEDNIVKTEEPNPNDKKIPLSTDINWSEFVLEQFADSEKFKGNPKVDGLRRVTELLVGEIIESSSNVIQTAELSNDNRVTVEHSICIKCDDGTIKRFTDAADVYPGNCDAFYSIYPTALACTRAEGRALRKALRLRGVAAEEISEDPPEITMNKEIKIKDFQINAIDIACKRCDIDVNAFIKNSSYGPFNNIYEVPYNVAARFIISLNQMQQNPSKIITNIKGYKENWRS
jgi:hypothetical protein